MIREMLRQPIDAILIDVIHERFKQNDKWGVQRHPFPSWMSLLTEEVGEACKDANEINWVKDGSRGAQAEKLEALRTELIQVAAVAVAIVEHLDEDLAALRTVGTNE